MEKVSKSSVLKFIVPSVIGILIFMIPVKYQGDWTICVKIIADIIGNALASVLPALCVVIITISAILSAAFVQAVVDR